MVNRLDAEARYARDRLTLARRREALGRGRPGRVAELQRVKDSADERLRHATRTAAADPLPEHPTKEK